MSKNGSAPTLTIKASLYPFEVLSDVANQLANRLTVIF
jgi:hypothetical protein